MVEVNALDQFSHQGLTLFPHKTIDSLPFLLSAVDVLGQAEILHDGVHGAAGHEWRRSYGPLDPEFLLLR